MLLTWIQGEEGATLLLLTQKFNILHRWRQPPSQDCQHREHRQSPTNSKSEGTMKCVNQPKSLLNQDDPLTLSLVLQEALNFSDARTCWSLSDRTHSFLINDCCWHFTCCNNIKWQESPPKCQYSLPFQQSAIPKHRNMCVCVCVAFCHSQLHALCLVTLSFARLYSSLDKHSARGPHVAPMAHKVRPLNF